MDRYLVSNVPHIFDLQRTKAQTVETSIDEAIQRMQIAASDSYDNVSVFSIYWNSDDTGGAEDSSLFIQTLSKLQNVQTFQRSLSDDDELFTLGPEIRAASQPRSRKLFILHYAGHAIAGSTPDTLIITPKIGQELGKGPEMNMSVIKDELKNMSSRSLGLDVLLVMDSCYVAITGRGRKAKGARVELMAATATARKGISNSRRTFTQHWCEAFTKLLEIRKPFTCDDIINDITPGPELEQFPFTFVLREGWDLPITFRLHPGPTESTLPAAVTSRTVITAFHVEENLNSRPLEQLIDYLNKASSVITVLAVLPTESSTLLLLHVPVILEELLVLPRVALILTGQQI
ncbi:hypothetical protein M378DRAFT_161299 [Amanita muscaria Koide BX008]|uniref:Uncharacterized protein n=1 Tax=Amanita muscaria (strain Koide BX008) TaxID=946122 RepID=A0A0C2TGQ2_AMAMK|nr:hypothetical protein M378DRAFT_161299 [Amanita muscaria Koide BX008]